MSDKIIQLNQDLIKHDLKDLVRNCNQRAQTDGFAEQNGRDAERADLTCRY